MPAPLTNIEGGAPPGGSLDGQVLRIDALLRARYPHLITRVFEREPFLYVIVFGPQLQEAAEIAAEFDHEIRFVTVPVTLSNSIPTVYRRELAPLSERRAAGDLVGLPLRRIDFLNLILSRFPDCGVIEVRDVVPRRADGQLELILVLSTPLRPVEQAEIVSFVDALGYGVELSFEVAAGQEPRVDQSIDNVLFIWAARLRRHAPNFVREDEAFWFDNLEKVAAGDLTPERFPGRSTEATRCYIDLAFGKEHLNLRQLLLLYDEVWCSLPLAHDVRPWLHAQGLTREDLVFLVGAGRLSVVTTQPEERLDISLLEALHERRPLGIRGRRTTAALLLTDLARTAERSRLNDPAFYPALKLLAEGLAPAIGAPASELLRSLLWPRAARLGALQPLLDRGSKGGPALLLARNMAERFRAMGGPDVELELLSLSERVHVAHALDATSFGALDEPDVYQRLGSALGHELNFHRSFNTSIAASWVGNEQRRAQGVSILPAIPLFEFDPRVPIQELVSDTGLGSTRAKGRALFTRLADLPTEARQAEIDDMETKLRTRARRRAGAFLNFDTVDTALALASLAMSFVYPPVAGIASAAGRLSERLRRVPAIDSMLLQLEEETLSGKGRNTDLDFLSRISRVAAFRGQRV